MARGEGPAKPRLRDVAREAGVSLGAASDSLSGKNQISEETRQRVRDAAKRLGYVPDPSARALSSGKVRAIGFVIGALQRPGEFAAYRTHWADVIGAGTLAATERGYAFTVLPGLEGELMVNVPVSGLMVLDTGPQDPYLEAAFGRGVPVLTDGVSEDDRVAVDAHLDFRSAVAEAMDHFAEQGATRPSLMWPKLQTVSTRELERGYLEWCEQHDVQPLLFIVDLEAGGTNEAIEALLRSPADAVLVAVPVTASLIEAAEKRGLNVGKDLRVITLDENSDRRLEQLDISTLAYSIAEYVDGAVARFIDVIEGKRPPGQRSNVALSFTARGSSLGTRLRRRAGDQG